MKTTRLPLLPVLAAALGLAAGSARAADSLTMADFVYTNKLMVAGYTGGETLTNFPVLVRISTSLGDFQYSRMRSSKGGDLAFFAEDGTRLASEVDTWTTGGTSLVWVTLPRMEQGTKFYMCYRLTDALAALDTMVENPNPWGDYVGVWHLGETGGSNTVVRTSTTNGLDGLTYAGEGNGSGAVGKARRIAKDYDHAWGIVVDVLSDPTKKALAESLGTDFHASFWMLAQAAESNLKYGTLLCRRQGDQGHSWMMAFGGDNKAGQSIDYMRVNSDNPNTANIFTEQPIGSFLKLNNTVWKKVDIVWKYATNGNDPAVDIYTNGVIAETITSARNPMPVRQENANIGIGGATQDNPHNANGFKGRRFNGSMDEVRLRPGLLTGMPSADWIKADFDTVNNGSFVTVAPSLVLDVTWAEDSGRAGVTNVAWNAVVVGGEVTGFGENTTEVAIEGKFWTGETEPSEWTVLTNGLGLLDAFAVSVPCAENTVYNYKLRATDDANGETDPVTGTFTTPLGLAATWAAAFGRSGVTNVLGHSVVVGGSVDCLGASATVSVEGRFWAAGETEPSTWTTLVGPLSQTGDFSVSVSGLSVDTLYNYKLRVAGSNGNATEPVSGTFTTSQGLRVSWAGDAGQPGVTNVAWNAAVVGGVVEALGDVASCDIEGKFWADGASEPSQWTALGAGGFGLGAFSVPVTGLAENTTYRYRLRATESDGSETPAASGTFTTPVGLAATWADVAGRPGIAAVGVFSATAGGSVDCLGDSETCTVEGKFWTGETEPENWTTLGEMLSQTGAFAATVPNLAGGTAYSYKLRLLGSNGAATAPVTGSFTTEPGLTIAWSSATAATGISRVSYDFVVANGTVSALGDATSCAIQGKFWAAAGAEPGEWTTLATDLGLDDGFNASVPGLASGTAYSYRLRAVGNDGEETAAVSGSFTTDGEAGEEIGSEYTQFFDDGTNSYWVAKGFERYLQFTVTGYTGTETLTNFPVLVDVRKADTNGFSYDDFYHADGRDMVFVDEKGHIIPHEIDTWNKNGMSLFWVRLPRMNNGTTFTMCYRSPLVDPLPDVGNTFERYVGVWHMNEKEDGIVSLKDSTTNNLPGESHAQSLAYGSGRIGGARRVAQAPGASSTSGNIVVYDHDDILRTGVGNVFTYSCWSKLVDNDPGWAYLVSRRVDDFSAGWGVQYHDKSDSAKKLRVWSGENGKNNSDFVNIQGCGYSHTSWACWTFVFDGNGPFGPGTNGLFHAFFNGEELPSTVGGLPLRYPVENDEDATFDHLVIGGQQNGTGALNGYVDECRYSKGVRSADWIKAEYHSCNQQQFWNDSEKRFVTKGTSVGRGAESTVPVVVWEQGAELPVSIVDVSYAYVQFAGTVTFCGTGAETCDIEYLLWADGDEEPSDADWASLLADAGAGTSFSIPVTGLKQDMPYRFRLRAVNEVGGVRQANRELTGSFRTNGNVTEVAEGELLRVDNRFCHLFRAGSYTFTTPDYVTNVEIMVVGGGGAGGYKVGGGGGGGGLFYSESFPVATSTVYRIQVGQGGNAATSLAVRSQNGELSYFARLDIANDATNETVLIQVPGGGAGGSYSPTASIAIGASGASGGGGTYAKAGGDGDGVYGHDGGAGNDKTSASGKSKTAAGGGGGAGRDGLPATADNWWAGGAGGVGVGCDMTGEMLYYGAGGGGGYQYFTDGTSYTRHGGGGSGIGGDAADVRNGTLAGSGVENTGAGGGGGSMTYGAGDEEIYWQGGDGGDGVVLIAYEVHGRDPISEDPRIEMTRCAYNPSAGEPGTGLAEIDYRAYWAGIQASTNDVYVLYSTAGLDEITNGIGERIQIASGAIGVGTATFVPPEVGHTYWIRLVSRKDASSFMYSDEIASFFVPAVTLNGVLWQNGTTNAVVEYALHDPDPDTHLHCYWSESRDQLEGDATPSGDGVRFLDLGVGMANATSFVVPASEGLDRSRVYYFRLAAGDDGGLRQPLSAEIVELRDDATVILSSASWADQVATVGFTANLVDLDPERTELVAFYSTNVKDVNDDTVSKQNRPHLKGAPHATLGTFAELAEGKASFPLWSDANATYYVRLALHSTVDDAWPTYSSVATIKEISVTGVNPNTLLIFANANPKKGAYGDAPQALDFAKTYGGLSNEVTMAAEPAVSGQLSCAVTSTSDSGIYDIGRGSLGIDPAESEKYIDGTNYYFRLVFVGAQYTVTNAVFSATIPDIATNYTGEALDTSSIAPVVTGVRNNQPVTYRYRVGTNDWTSSFDTTFSNIWMNIVQFKASAPNHEDAAGTFMVTIEPAPLFATISAPNLNYTGAAQTPAVSTNVTGHMHPERNPLTCLFRDDAGEWQSEVPSFTQPGTYRLWFRVSAPNHATFTTNCTFTVAGWDFRVNMDGESGYRTPLRVTDPAWFIRNSGRTGEELADADTRNAALDARCANGLKLWQNYVLERELDDALVAAIHQDCPRVAENHFEVRFPNVSALRNTGLDIGFRLDRKLTNEVAITQGTITDKYELNVPLGPSDPTGLYVFNIVLSTTNDTPARAVLPSCATVGVLRVTSSATNVVAAVPWMAMADTNPANVPVLVSETVNPNGLSAGDRILAYASASNFNAWAYESGTTWNTNAAGTVDGVAVVDATTNRFGRGGAFWLVRTDPGEHFYLVGRYTGDEYSRELAGGSSAAPGCTLVANPTFESVALADLAFVDGSGDPAAPAAGDRIVFQDATGFQRVYVRDAANEEWGRHVSRKENGRIVQRWAAGGAPDDPRAAVPSGTGFWYVRTADSPLFIRFGGEE